MTDSTRDSIEEFYRQWFGAMEKEDIDDFITLLAADFYIKPPGQSAITDIAKLRKNLELYHKTFKSIPDWEIEEIRFFDSHAVVRITESITLVDRSNNKTMQVIGVHLSLLQSDEKGGWQLKTDVSSLNQSPETEG